MMKIETASLIKHVVCTPIFSCKRYFHVPPQFRLSIIFFGAWDVCKTLGRARFEQWKTQNLYLIGEIRVYSLISTDKVSYLRIISFIDIQRLELSKPSRFTSLCNDIKAVSCSWLELAWDRLSVFFCVPG